MLPKKDATTDTVQTYSPFSLIDRIIFCVLILVGLFTFGRFTLWWFQPSHIPSNWISQQFGYLSFIDFTLFGILTFVVFFGFILKIGTWYTTFFMRRPRHIDPAPNLKVAFVTCYVPGKEPIEMLEDTLIAMRNADYKHDTWVLDEGNTDEVKSLSKKLGIKYFSRADKTHYNQLTGPFKKKTKAGNLNSWRNEFEHDYDIVAQVDMDHVPHKNYFIKLLGYFRDPKVGFVGIPQIYKNTNNWIARAAAEQTHFYYGPLQQGFYGAHMPFLIGTTHIYRVSAMKSFGGYSPTIAEDYLTGLHFFSNNWRGVYVPEILTEGLGPVTLADYFNQQMRWSYGLFEILFKYSHKHFKKINILQKINLFFSQLFYFSGITNFLGILLTSAYLIVGINSTNMSVYEWAIHAIPAYLSGILIMIFLHKFYINPKKEPVFGVLGMFLGQAASIIYAIALFKFITGRSLTYKVTSKNVNESTSFDPSVFTVHIFILLFCILSLEISFLNNNDSVVMRFWALTNVFFITGLIFTALWNDLVKIFFAIISHYHLVEFNSVNKYKLPDGPTNFEKYLYISRNYGLFIFFSIISFTTFSICLFIFLINNELLWPLLGYLMLTIIYFLISLSVNTFSKTFDLELHKNLISRWKKFNKPSVDIFLPTAGEDLQVLKNTWDGISELKNHYQGPIQIYCLDDANRQEVKELAQRYNFKYEVRPNRGWYKKAGNLRHGFSISNGEYILIFDADFRPRFDFLDETLPYMLENPKLGIVQTPQYFDVNKSQNWLQRGAGAVQELFYRFSQVSRQSHNASICVGSNAIYRRSALMETGGTALIEHSEDVHTGFNLRMIGWDLMYVPIILAKGLCPDDMRAFFNQQYRWCLGSMSLLSSKKFWQARLTFRARMAYFSGFLYYIHTAVSSFFVPVIPIILILYYPEQVNLRNYLLIIPSLIFIQIIFPSWHKSVYGMEAWATRSIYGWAHLLAILDKLFKNTMQWHATGSKTSNRKRYFVFRSCQFIFNFIPALAWVVLAGNKVIVHNNFVFAPLLFTGLYYFLITCKVTFYSKSKIINFQIPVYKYRYGILLITLSIIIGINNFYIYQKFFLSEKISTAFQNHNILGITAAETIDSSQSTQKQIEFYTEVASKNDNMTRLVRRIIEKYCFNQSISLDKQKRDYIENYLIHKLPSKKIFVGSSITIDKSTLDEAFNEAGLR